MKNNFKKIGRNGLKGLNIFLTMMVLVIIPIVAFTLITSKTDKLAGIKSFVVLTGSMEPGISTGSVIFTKPSEAYKKGEVIAFNKDGKTITHRIVDAQITNGAFEYTTRGDANNANDSEAVLGASVVGQQVFALPYLGKIILFLSTSKGFVVFIVTPIILFVLLELWNIKKELEKSIEKKLVEKMKAEANFGFR